MHDGNLTLSSGAEVIRYAGLMSFLPNLDGWFDVTYEGSCVTGNEIPAGATSLRYLTIDLLHGIVVLGRDVLVNRALVINSGTLDTDGHTLTMGPNAIVDGDPSDIDGDIEGEPVAVGSGEYSNPGLGFYLTAGNDLGNLELLVFSEPVTWEESSGIARRWRIEADNPPSGRDMTLSWYDTEDNGCDLTNMQVWRSTDGGHSWVEVGNPVDVTGTGQPAFGDRRQRRELLGLHTFRWGKHAPGHALLLHRGNDFRVVRATRLDHAERERHAWLSHPAKPVGRTG